MEADRLTPLEQQIWISTYAASFAAWRMHTLQRGIPADACGMNAAADADAAIRALWKGAKQEGIINRSIVDALAEESRRQPKPARCCIEFVPGVIRPPGERARAGRCRLPAGHAGPHNFPFADEVDDGR